MSLFAIDSGCKRPNLMTGQRRCATTVTRYPSVTAEREQNGVLGPHEALTSTLVERRKRRYDGRTCDPKKRYCRNLQNTQMESRASNIRPVRPLTEHGLCTTHNNRRKWPRAKSAACCGTPVVAAGRRAMEFRIFSKPRLTAYGKESGEFHNVTCSNKVV